MKKQISVCYYPTTVLFLDDKKRFLSGLATNIDKNIAYRPFASPQDALDFIKKTHIPNPLPNSCFSSLKEAIDNESSAEFDEVRSAIDIDVSEVYEEMYNPKRFERISVVVVDYAMPGMNGVEFAKQVKQIDPSFKVLMITGEADDAIAIDAFNEGIINKFIRKGSHTFYDEVNQEITELQQEYFHDLSQRVVDSLTVAPTCCLNDPAFIKAFQDFCAKKKICEYYLIDEIGSFLLLDEQANPYWIVIKSDQNLADYYDIARDGEAPMAVQKALKQRDKVLFLFTTNDEFEPVSVWGDYLYPAKKLVGKSSDYYYAFIEGVEGYTIYPEKVKPYQKYLAEVAE
jgi:CheY-like chemotaxis protein